MRQSFRQSGFTMVELIVVMVISVVLGGVVSQFISHPIEIYANQEIRARLVSNAEYALHRLERDVHNSVPNSVRVGCGGQCVEFLGLNAAGRYRAAAPGNALGFNPVDNDTSFEVLGELSSYQPITTSGTANACQTGNADCLIIYNTGLSGSNVYTLDNTATITSVSGSSPVVISFDNTQFASGSAAFPLPSPNQHFSIATGAVTYLCDTSAGTLRKYWGYPITSNQASIDTNAELMALSGTVTALMATAVTACTFNYSPGSTTRSGLLVTQLQFTENNANGSPESIKLLKQTHVVNTP